MQLLPSHKKYAEGFTIKNLLVFEICTSWKSKMFVCKHTETIEYVNKQATFFNKNQG